MKKKTLILIFCLVSLFSMSQNPSSYRLFRGNGEEVSFQLISEEILTSNVILFGELHDNPIAHWLQLELSHALIAKNANLILGAEMFESDCQIIVDEYLSGQISQSRFESEARIWPNYKTDYKPLIELAKSHKLPFIATNIPRRYAAMVATGGFEVLDGLSAQAKSYISPLPVDYDPELPGYAAMLNMGGMSSKPVNDNFPKAQAIKDATMAWNISQNMSKGSIFLHFHGTYHSNNYEGIVWYLNRYAPTVSVKTIATVLQKEVEQLNEESIGLADFILVIPERMTRTY